MPASPITGAHLDTARDAGISPDGPGRAFVLLDDWIGRGVLPGAAALVARGDGSASTTPTRPRRGSSPRRPPAR